MKVFISHSVGKAELRFVHHLSASLTGAEVPNYLALHDRQPGVRLSEKVKSHIESSQVLIALLTRKGNQSSWVHDEIGYALGKGLKVFAFVEKSLKLDGMHAGAEYLTFDPTDPSSDIAALSERLARQRAEAEAASARELAANAQAQADVATIFAIAFLCVAVVALLLLAARR